MRTQLPEEYYAGDLFGEIYQARPEERKANRWAMVPGLAVCLTAALAAGWLADHYGFPIILLGLLIGLALSFVSEDRRTHAGLDFATRHFLRFGIVLLGLQVTIAQVMVLGWTPFAALLIVMASAMATGIFAARWTGQGSEPGILAGGATAICGASAALALYGAIGEDRLSRERLSITLVGVALASALAMAAYPVIAEMLGMNDSQAGFLIGASVHDAAQAIGGAYGYSDAAGQDATVVKLARIALLTPIVALTALWLGRQHKVDGQEQSLWKAFAVPWFITGFLALFVINSVVPISVDARAVALDVSKILLLLAVTAAAMRSRLGTVLQSGWKPLLPVLAATLVSFAVALAAALFLVS